MSIGQVVRYMMHYQVCYAFLSNYDSTIFLKICEKKVDEEFTP